MKRGYWLELRLAVVGAIVTASTLTLSAGLVALEFIHGEFAIEERSLLEQAADWATRVEADPAGGVRFVAPAEPVNGPDAPYTGVLVGQNPIYGYALIDQDGNEISSSGRYVLSRSATLAAPGKPVLVEGLDRETGNLLFVAEIFVPQHGVFLRVARLRSDEAARANTFFAHVVEDFLWLSIVILVVMTAATALTIRVSLAGLKRVARQAEGLDVENLPSGNLDAESAPREIQPMVKAFNAALDRIGAGMLAKRDFSIHVAHELRTPLADLRLRIEGAPLGSDRETMLSDIDAMARLIEQLLHVARLDVNAGFALGPISLADVVSAALSELAPRLVAHGWELEFDACCDSGLLVVGEEILVQLVLRNLIENVIRHAGSGGVVQVAIGPGPQVIVADDGSGIDPENRSLLFEKFSPGRGDIRKGSGLGLAICRSAMERMGGSIELEMATSRLGSRFVMRFKPDSPAVAAARKR